MDNETKRKLAVKFNNKVSTACTEVHETGWSDRAIRLIREAINIIDTKDRFNFDFPANQTRSEDESSR